MTGRDQINLERLHEATDAQLAEAHLEATRQAHGAPKEPDGGSMTWARRSREAFRLEAEIVRRDRTAGANHDEGAPPMPVNRPWRIDEDNLQRIVIVDDRGQTVHHVNYEDLPRSTADAMFAQERANCRAMVGAVNAVAECSKCGEWVDGTPCDADCPHNSAAEQYRLAMEKVTPNLLKDNTMCRRVIADGRAPDPVTGLPLETDTEFRARIMRAGE
jgi:hypothetical protein